MLSFDIDHLTNWISQNPDWALFIVFGIAFIESLAVIGLLMPGWLLLVGVGVLIGTGNLNFYLASLFCFGGAVCGEYISYLVGVKYQDQVHHWKIFQRHPDWLKKTEHFFERYGIASIALGRYVGPVRAFVPLMAGMSSMPFLKFKITTVLSALVWAPAYLTPGIILGAAVQIDPTVRWLIISNLVVIVVSLWLTLTYFKNIWRIRHPDFADTEYDHSHVVIKAIIALGVLIAAIIYMTQGPQHEQFVQLINLLWGVINQ